MAIKRLPGDEATLLRAALDRIDGMLRPDGLAAEYGVDVQHNSYSASVHAEGLGFDETWMRLQRYDELRAILEGVVFTPDERRERWPFNAPAVFWIPGCPTRPR